MITLFTRTQNSLALALSNTLSAGTTYAGPLIELFNGTKPADPEATNSATILARVVLPYPTFAAPSLGVITLNSPVNVLALASGTATWFRMYDRDRNGVLDGSVTDTSGTGDLRINDTQLVINGYFTITEVTFRFEK